MDTWILLKAMEVGGERNRALYVLKSRGMEHSNQIREFVLTNHGLELLDVYLGPEGVLTGSARVSQEGREKAAGTSRRQHLEGRGRELDRKREIFEARMTMLRAEFEKYVALGLIDLARQFGRRDHFQLRDQSLWRQR